MALSNEHGGVIGRLDHHQRDPINNYRQFCRQNVYVTTHARITGRDVPTSKPFNGHPVS